tara:strand:+ start:86 stop:3877 length:3792 start_codon:yes stop_codon:yes gene_type:complete
MEFDAMLELAQSKDSKERLQAIQAAQAHVDSTRTLDPGAVPLLVDVLGPGLKDTHCKVVQGSLDLALLLVGSLEEGFAPFLANLWPAIIDRLGDAKAALRKRAVDLAVSAATIAVPVLDALEFIRPAFQHRNWRARESALFCISRIFATSQVAGGPKRSGEDSGTLDTMCKSLLAIACKLLEDQQPLVREASAKTLEEMHRHCINLPGKLRRRNIRLAVLKPLLSRLSTASNNDEVLDAKQDVSVRLRARYMNDAQLGQSPPSRHNGELMRGEQGGGVKSGRAPVRCDASTRCLRGVSPKPTRRSIYEREEPEGAVASDSAYPVAVSSELELACEMEAVSEQLQNQVEWSVRQGGLRRLQELVVGGAADFEVFADKLRGMRDLLVAQCIELRSSLVKDACKLVQLLVAHMRGSFEPFVDIFLPALLKNTVVTIAVISCSSHETIIVILTHVPTVKSLDRLIAGLGSRSSTMRTRCAEYLTLLFERMRVYPEGERSPLERHLEATCATIRVALADSNEQVRTCARECYRQLQKHVPRRCQRLLGTLDRPTQRLIKQEKPPKFEFKPGILAEPLAAQRPPTTCAVGGCCDCMWPPDERLPSAPTYTWGLHKGISERDGLVGVAKRREHTPAGKPFSVTVRRCEALDDEDRRCHQNTINSRDNEASVGICKRGSYERDGNGNSRKDERGRIEKLHFDQAIALGDYYGLALSTLLIQMGAAHWSARAKACVQVAALLNLESCLEVVPLLEKLGVALIELLADPHFEVVRAALEGIHAFIQSYPQSLTPLLEDCIARILECMHEQRPEMRTAATTVIEALQVAVAPASFVHALLGAANTITAQVRSTALRLFSTSIASAAAYLISAQHMRAAITKVIRFLVDKNADVHRAALDALLALHDISATAFVSQAVLLTLHAQNLLKTQMGPTRPNFVVQLIEAQRARLPSSAALTPEELLVPTHRNENSNQRSTGSRGHRGRFEAATAPVAVACHERCGSNSCRKSEHVALVAQHALLPHQLPQHANSIVEPWHMLMPMLLWQLTGDATATAKIEALLKMKELAILVPAEALMWTVHFEHALEAVLRVLQQDKEPLRKLSLACTKELLRAQPHRFRTFTEHVILRLISCGRDPSHEGADAAEETLLLLLSVSDPHRCLTVLVPVVMREEPPKLQLTLRLIAKLVGYFSQVQLLCILPQLLPPLFESFRNPNADVRKAVVFCLVDMYLVLGEQLTPHLTSLTTSQLKLVTIYVNKTIKARECVDPHACATSSS